MLGLGSYETAWVWLHKLRRAMVLPGRELLSGAVEVDETSVGARHTSVGGRSPGHKAIVVIAVEGDRAPERVRMRRVPNVKRDTLTEFVLDHVARGSEVRTDAWTGYDDIGRYRFTHVVTNVSATGDPAHVALPHVHLVASLVKRWVLGTHQGAISHAQLDYYLDEFTFRFNRRRARHRGLLFYRLLEGALAADPRPYKEASANRSPDQPHGQSGERSGYPVSRKARAGALGARRILRGDAVVGAKEGECTSHSRIALRRSQSRADRAAAVLQLAQTGARGSSW